MMQTLDANGIRLAGTNLIEASAGTGKTYAIAMLYVRSLLETRARVENILVVTYTRAATAELRDRIRKRIAETREALRTGRTKDETLQALVSARIAGGSVDDDCKRLTLALRSFDQAAIFTIHGFCQRCLQESAFESGTAFESEFEADDMALAQEIAEDFWANEMFAADASLFAYYQRQGMSPDTLRKLAQEVIGNPDIDILPATTDNPSEGSVEAFAASYERARRLWNECRDEILEVLTSCSALKKTSYKPEQIHGKYAPTLDSLFASENPTLVDDKHELAKLSIQGLAKGTKKGATPPEHEFFEAASSFLSACGDANTAFESQLLALRLRLVAYVRQESVSRKAKRSTLSFDDLLLSLRAALRKRVLGEQFAGDILARYPIALIDEFQDTDPVQYEVFRRIYHRGGEAQVGRALFLIGDPKQAIYGFRGADLFTYFRARSDAADDRYTLATNYRSSPDMVCASNSIFESPRESFLFDELEFSAVKPAPDAANTLVDEETSSAAMEILMLDRRNRDGSDGTLRLKSGAPRAGGMNKDTATAKCVDRISGEIVRLLCSDATIDGRQVEPGDIAVLVRSNRQARAMQEALGSRGVPSVLESDGSVFTTEDAEELGRVLRAMAFPGDRRAIRAALATRILGRTANDLAHLRESEEDWEEALFGFRRWHETWMTRGFFPAFSQMMHEESVAERLLAHMGGERKMTNLGQLAELLQERALQDSVGPQVLCAWLDTMRVDAAARKGAGDSEQLRLETDAASVTVVTVHKSKGLEYGIVYCPFAWQGQHAGLHTSTMVRFHDNRDDSRLKLDIGSEDIDAHRKLSAREALAEDLRLLYVALTRAKHRCSVVCGVISSFGSSALAYLLLRDDSLETTWESLKDFEMEIEKLEDDDLWTKLQVHVERRIAVRRLLPYEGPSYERRIPTKSSLQSRKKSRALSSAWRTTSFTGLSRSADSEHDHDAGNKWETASHLADDPGSEITMAKVPAGAHAGQMLHHIFETLDFGDAHETSSESLSQTIAHSLESHGYDMQRWQAPLMAAFRETLLTPLPAPEPQSGFCLASVERGKRLDELEFNIPIRTERQHFQASMLADALDQRTAPPWPEYYPGLVRGLGFRPLTGFLKGFMDVVFEHEGRWYLADYKSNMLGDRYGDYRSASLARAMTEHHYYLQYHLYLVALDRYLRLRIPGYDYDRHFGGVYYLFMRGMHPDAPIGNGVFFDRPTAAEVATLSTAFEGDRR